MRVIMRVRCQSRKQHEQRQHQFAHIISLPVRRLRLHSPRTINLHSSLTSAATCGPVPARPLARAGSNGDARARGE